MKTKFFSLFLIFLLLTQLAACATDNDIDSNDDTDSSESISDTAEESTSLFPEKVTSDFSFDGQKFHFLSREESDGYWDIIDISMTEETNGEVINDLLYERNVMIEDTFDCDISQDRYMCGEQMQILANSVKAMDNLFQAVMTTNYRAPNMMFQGLFIDMNKVNNFDFSKYYWDQQLNDSISVLNRQYYAVGDMNLMTTYATSILLFNKQLAEDYQLPDFYQLVDEGKWTIDLFTEQVLAFNDDLNGDGTMNDYDQWGLAITSSSLLFMFGGCGQSFAYKDADGYLIYNTLTDSMALTLDKLTNVLKQGNVLNAHDMDYNPGGMFSWGANVQTFENDQALFFNETLRATTYSLREMESEYGLLPMPKLDEEQKNYISPIQDWGSSVVAIPTSNAAYEDVAMLIEMMCSYNSIKLYDAFVQTVCYKGLRDEKSLKVFDMLYKNRYFDVSSVIDGNALVTPLMAAAKAGGGNYASTYEKALGVCTKNVSKIMKRIESLEY